MKGIQKGVKQDLELDNTRGPKALGDRLEVMSKEKKYQIEKIDYDKIKKEFDLHGSGTKW